MRFLTIILWCAILIGCSVAKDPVKVAKKKSVDMNIPEIYRIPKVVNSDLRHSFPKKENLILIYSNFEISGKNEVVYSLFPVYDNNLSLNFFFSKEDFKEEVYDTIDFLLNEEVGYFECMDLVPENCDGFLMRYFVRKIDEEKLSININDSLSNLYNGELIKKERAFQISLYSNLKSRQIGKTPLTVIPKGNYASIFKTFELSEFDYANNYEGTTRQLISSIEQSLTDMELTNMGGSFFLVNKDVVSIKKVYREGNSSTYGIVVEYFKKNAN